MTTTTHELGAMFEPSVTVAADGTIGADWFDSFRYLYDQAGDNPEEPETSTARAAVLDARLDAIRDALAGDTSPLAELVRPFFASRLPSKAAE
jgi:hypothetical protein